MRTNSINAPAMPEGQQDESGLGRFWTWRHDSSLGGRFYDTRDMRVAGDMISGALLAQAIYWSDGRLRVQIDGELYIAKTHEEWASELEVVSSSQAKRAIERLANILVMDTDNKRRIRKPRPGESVLKPGDEVLRPPLVELRHTLFNGYRTACIRILWDNLLPLYEDLWVEPEHQEPDANCVLPFPGQPNTPVSQVRPTGQPIASDRSDAGARPLTETMSETTPEGAKREGEEMGTPELELQSSSAEERPGRPTKRDPSLPTAGLVQDRLRKSWLQVHRDGVAARDPEALSILSSLTKPRNKIAQQISGALPKYSAEVICAGYEHFLRKSGRELEQLHPPGWYLTQLAEHVPRSVSERHAEWLHAQPAHRAPNRLDRDAELPDFIKKRGGWRAEIEKCAKQNAKRRVTET